MVRFVVTIKLKPGAKEVLDLPGIWKGLSEIDAPFTDLQAFEYWFDHPDHYRISGHVDEYVEDTSRVVYDIPA